ncbi:unnamed protein product [Closterium sp. NIES-64]|nr:unnamed protein product [Closterium sp. NIES-64]
MGCGVTHFVEVPRTTSPTSTVEFIAASPVPLVFSTSLLSLPLIQLSRPVHPSFLLPPPVCHLPPVCCPSRLLVPHLGAPGHLRRPVPVLQDCQQAWGMGGRREPCVLAILCLITPPSAFVPPPVPVLQDCQQAWGRTFYGWEVGAMCGPYGPEPHAQNITCNAQGMIESM